MIPWLLLSLMLTSLLLSSHGFAAADVDILDDVVSDVAVPNANITVVVVSDVAVIDIGFT